MSEADRQPQAIALCRFNEIADPGARGFEIEGPDGLVDIIVVRQGEAVHGYLNRCPHKGTPLETFPDRFLSRDGTELICSTHGARFRVENGHCTEGPCLGASLRPAHLEIAGGKVILIKA